MSRYYLFTNNPWSENRDQKIPSVNSGKFYTHAIIHKIFFYFTDVILFAQRSQLFGRLLNIICGNKRLTKKVFCKYTVVISRGQSTQKGDM